MLARTATFLVAAVVTSVFFIQFCATVFQCGCQAIWGAGAEHCNIHNAAGGHCPWCVYGTTGYAAVYGSMLTAQAAVSFWPGGRNGLVRLAVAVGAFPAMGLVMALVLGTVTGYWNP